MTDTIHPVPEAAAADTRTTLAQYHDRYARSIADPDGFWREQLPRLDWLRTPTVMGNWSWDPVRIRWFEDGMLNAAANCLDRHDPAATAIVWEADAPGAPGRRISYGELLEDTCRMANALVALGVERGDRVTIYMPMIPEAAVAMLACARIGAVHSVVFGGFSAEAIAGRLEDADSRFVITADEGRRGGKTVPLKACVDEALDTHATAQVEAVLVVRHTGGKVAMHPDRDHWWHELRSQVPATCTPEPMNAEDPLFILYTSGSTGKPKGVLHTTAGYLLWANLTFETVFDYKAGELFWCTADVGWITGHSYIVYGPLSAGATILMFEGIPSYPASDRFWQVIEKHRVNIFYTAPTALRAVMRDGDAPVLKHDLSSLRLLGTVGEPINPEAWNWYDRVVGKGKLPIVDTWWQTETGGALITPLPGATPTKPGSATLPFYGVQPALVDAEGTIIPRADGEEISGNLVLLASWPGQARSLHGDHERFTQTYFTTYRGKYFTSDGARQDKDGYWWITGRVDDVINVSGHRMGTAEVESALVAHQDVAEAAVVGFPHDIKGQAIYAYVTLNAGIPASDALLAALRATVRHEIGGIAVPDHIHITPGLPKTRSGKIMRRILRKIAENDFASLGDTSTLADPSVVEALIEGRLNR
ncbi:acetate--CoA ligase [Polymorphobacter fuscus]|uniref:Acetyl-coenzyme A synthetase n=1 Tax=Sandarakinorhabdus fusca TaxID=1439888 RepID=A0A7C9KHP7_9SPHN|nr:acetate--CoA ligase [Polymorphobacter fuscus]KAB7647761.1 acetate--CoA ligase [Polymorphobacter fuscus]MQT17060.1 acetate--CoA ligase [Polymorphobacter fuscus]NJC08948.1 acetyl-CoA synthetase [Polymorphobacter fuscus]